MGVNLTPISVRRRVELAELRGMSLAVDAPGELHQFLSIIRKPDGTLLMDSTGRVTSHLSGLFYRTTRLVGEHRLRLAFVFDGPPPALKAAEIERRRAVRQRFERGVREALEAGEMAQAWSRSTMTSRLTREMVEEAKTLLDLLGIPWLDAPGEAEAQASTMAARGEVWGAASKDYDALLFGAPRLVRFLGIAGKELLPSKGIRRPVHPELIELEGMLEALGITREGLVDVAILIGNDFIDGVKGVGPRTALKLIRAHGALEALPPEVLSRVPAHYPEVREIFLRPSVTPAGPLRWRRPDREGVEEFLCGEREFSADRVRRALERMEEGRG